jgi:hypothetical protein
MAISPCPPSAESHREMTRDISWYGVSEGHLAGGPPSCYGIFEDLWDGNEVRLPPPRIART